MWWIITFLEKVWLVHTMMYAVDWNYIPRYSKWIQLVHICLPIVSRDMMMNYYIPWKKVWQLHAMMYAVDWKLYTTISKVNTMVNRCVPIVSRDMMMNYCIPWKSLTGAYHDVRRGLKIIHTTISKVNTTVIQRYTSVFHCLQRYDEFTLVIAIFVDRNYISIVYWLSPEMYIFWKSWIPWCTPWIENYTHHDIQSEYNDIHLSSIVSRDMMISLWSSRYPWIEIIFPLSPEMWWWITTFLEKKVWLVNTMMHAVDWNYISLSPEMWWFHFSHRNIRG